MADTKKEHYVPRCYLENFATNQKRINVFDKWKTMVRNKQDIMQVAMENGFYDLDLMGLMKTLDGEKYKKMQHDLMEIVRTNDWEDVEKIISNKKYIEKEHFVEIEGAYSRVLKSIIHKSYNGNSWVMQTCYAKSKEEKLLLSYFIAIQDIRTKRFRETLSDLIEGTAQALVHKTQMNNEQAKTKEIFNVKANPDFVKLQHSMMVLQPEIAFHLAEILENHVWVMCVNKTELSFYTSDTPIVRIPHKRDKFMSHSGFASQGIEVAFPISPNLLLCMFDESTYGKLFKDRQFYEIHDLEEVKYYNSWQVIHSYRCVFSKNDDFSLALKLCQENSVLKEYQSEVEVI